MLVFNPDSVITRGTQNDITGPLTRGHTCEILDQHPLICLTTTYRQRSAHTCMEFTPTY